MKHAPLNSVYKLFHWLMPPEAVPSRGGLLSSLALKTARRAPLLWLPVFIAVSVLAPGEILRPPCDPGQGAYNSGAPTGAVCFDCRPPRAKSAPTEKPEPKPSCCCAADDGSGEGAGHSDHAMAGGWHDDAEPGSEEDHGEKHEQKGPCLLCMSLKAYAAGAMYVPDYGDPTKIIIELARVETPESRAAMFPLPMVPCRGPPATIT